MTWELTLISVRLGAVSSAVKCNRFNSGEKNNPGFTSLSLIDIPKAAAINFSVIFLYLDRIGRKTPHGLHVLTGVSLTALSGSLVRWQSFAGDQLVESAVSQWSWSIIDETIGR